MSARGASDRIAAAALWLPLLALTALVSLQQIRTFDYWWHLRTGQLIVETGSVPKVDPYTYTVPGARWVDVHWLHQLGLHGLHALGGHAAVVVAKLALVLALLGIVARIGYRRERPLVSAVALGLMLLVACDRFMPRPELSSFLLLAAQLALLDRFTRRGDAWVYAAVAVQVVWVNVHGLFALGLAVCAVYLFAEVVRPLLDPDQRFSARRVRRLAVLTALASLASLANPNGLDGALYPIQQLQMIGPVEERGVFGSLISELLPPFGERRSLTPLALGLFAALAASSFVAMALNWRRLHGADPLLWVAFLYLGLGAQRNLALFAIVAAPIGVRNLNAALDARTVPLAPRARLVATAAVSLALCAAAVDVARGTFWPRVNSMREVGLDVLDVFYPTQAAEWIARERPPGPIFHHMADGGYLIWRLYPDYRVMVDGRLEIFGPEKFVELMGGVPERFRALDEDYGFGTALVHYSLVESGELLWWLYLNSNWTLAHVDEVAALFVRVAEGAAPGEEVDVDDPNLFPPLDDDRGLRDLVRRMARTNFYTGLHRYDRALETWQAALEKYPDLPQGPVVHASLLQRNGFGAAAEAIVRRMLEARPDDALLRTRVGDLRLESGDIAAAKEFYDQALDLDPSLAYALYRRGIVAEAEGDAEGALSLYLRVLGASHAADPLAVRAALRVTALRGGV